MKQKRVLNQIHLKKKSAEDCGIMRMHEGKSENWYLRTKMVGMIDSYVFLKNYWCLARNKLIIKLAILKLLYLENERGAQQ